VTGSHDTRYKDGDSFSRVIKRELEEAKQAEGKGYARKPLPTDSEARKEVPLARGVLDFFPAALAEVARLSHAATQQHHPDKEMHHDRGKSTDHADCIIRHLAERGTEDTDGILHEVKVAWRALALLQEALEAKGAPLARGARLPDGVCGTPEHCEVSGGCGNCATSVDRPNVRGCDRTVAERCCQDVGSVCSDPGHCERVGCVREAGCDRTVDGSCFARRYGKFGCWCEQERDAVK
jgi:hypothetical protein